MVSNKIILGENGIPLDGRVWGNVAWYAFLRKLFSVGSSATDEELDLMSHEESGKQLIAEALGLEYVPLTQ